MSNIFTYLVRKTGGVLPLNFVDAIPPDATKSQGLFLDPDGFIYAQEGGIVDHWHQGLPFTDLSRLAVEQGEVAQYVSQSIPYTLSRRVLVNSGVTSHINQGLAYLANGALSVFPSQPFINWIDSEPWDDGEDWVEV